MEAKAPLLRTVAVVAAVLAGGAWTPPTSLPSDSSQVREVPGLIFHGIEGASLTDAMRAWGWEGSSGRALLYQVLLSGEWTAADAAVRIHTSFLANGGDGVATAAGDVQGVSNIEAAPTRRVYEAWLQASVGGTGTLLVGLYDLNSEFYLAEPATLFVNASHGLGAEFGLTGEAGPSVYPLTALSVRLDVPLGASGRWRTAVLDGVPGVPEEPGRWGIALSADEGALVISEVERTWADDRLRVVMGGWMYTASFPVLGSETGEKAWGNVGGYIMAESALAGCEGEGGCLEGFVRLGKAAGRFNTVGTGAGGGFVYRPSPDGWTVGAGITHAGPGSPYRRAMRLGAHEVNWEVTAVVPLGEHVALQPDLQFIHDPGMAAGYSRAVVGGVRVVLGF